MHLCPPSLQSMLGSVGKLSLELPSFPSALIPLRWPSPLPMGEGGAAVAIHTGPGCLVTPQEETPLERVESGGVEEMLIAVFGWFCAEGSGLMLCKRNVAFMALCL